MKIRIVFFVLVTAAVGGLISTFAARDRTPAVVSAQAAVERGRYLVTAVGCHDCHSPKLFGPNGPEPDPTRLLSGHPEADGIPAFPEQPAGPWMVVSTPDLTAWFGPWGISFPINLTPDENTGIGSWSEETFVQAIRTGRHMGVSRPILPPMPWPAYRNLSDDDLRAVYAYLRSVPPINNRVPEPVPPPVEPASAAS